MADDAPKSFTQEDIDNLTAKHQEEMTALQERLKHEYDRKADGLTKKIRAEMEEESKKKDMSELERANTELNEYKTKYEKAQSQIDITNQKDETRKILADMKLSDNCLDFVFIPNDIEGTKARAKAFKEHIDNVKKETFENNIKSTVPNKGNAPDVNDAFLQGFNSK